MTEPVGSVVRATPPQRARQRLQSSWWFI